MKKLAILLMLFPLVAVSTPNDQDLPACKENKHHGQHHYHKMKFDNGLPEYLEKLSLTEQQKTQIHTLMDQQAMSKQMHELWAKRKQIMQLGFEENIDQVQFEQMLEKYIVLEQDYLSKKVKTKHAIFTLLDDKQRAILKETASKMKVCKKLQHH